MSGRSDSLFVCPACRGLLASAEASLSCSGCVASFPVGDGVADFSGGTYYDAFRSERDVTPALLQGLEDEVAGTRARVSDFFLPKLRSLRSPGRRLRILDCGCGNGLSVDLLADAGFESWGNDSSLLRKWQWRDRRDRERLCVASGSRLPFPSASFDIVISSGVLEHVGVLEAAGPPYSARPAPDRDDARRAFLAELLRALSATGRLWLDFPNGRFPIDFWHGTGAGGARYHSLREGFLPTVAEVRRHVAALAPQCRVRAISPHRRLKFQRVRRRWFGKLLFPGISGFFRLMCVPGFRWLAASALNPYLVIEVTKHGDSRS